MRTSAKTGMKTILKPTETKKGERSNYYLKMSGIHAR